MSKKDISIQEKLIATFNIHIAGTGNQPVLFAHGLGCDQTMWRYVAPAFEEDYKVVLFDYIGSGKSDAAQYQKEKYATLDGYAADVLAICEVLELTNVIFVGHSVSCMIGMLAAIQKPQLFSNVVMVAPSPCYTNDSDYKGGFEKNEIELLLATMEKNMADWSNLFVPKIVGEEQPSDLSLELCESFCSTDPFITHQFARATFFADHRADLSRLTVPSLILQCREDVLAPLEVGTYMQKQMPANTLKILNATGHCPHLSAPEETKRVIRGYLASL